MEMGTDRERAENKVASDMKVSGDMTEAEIFMSGADFVSRRSFFDLMLEVFFEKELSVSEDVFVIFQKILEEFFDNLEKFHGKLERKIKKAYLVEGIKINKMRDLKVVWQEKEKGALIKVSGYLPYPGCDGKIEEFYFNLNPLPGTIGADNRMNYRRIFRFPKVKTGNKIIKIRNRVKEIHGIAYNGRLLISRSVSDYPLEVEEGVRKENFSNERGEVLGYYLVAERDGVIVSRKNEKGEITALSVKNKMTLSKVDYSSGDLGCTKGEIFPIELIIEGIIGTGFTINSEENITIEGSEGGILVSEKDIEAGNLYAGSTVSAKGSVTCKNVFRSGLKAGGLMTIKGDVIDSALETSELISSKRKDGRPNSLSNLRVKIEKAKLKGVSFSHENFISLGENLFSRKNEIAEEIPKRERESAETLARKDEISLKLKKVISSVIKKIGEREKFLEIIRSGNLHGLDEFKDIQDIEKIKKTHAEMVKVVHEAKDKEKELESLKRETESIDKKLSEMSLRISNSTLKSTGRLTIIVNGQEKLIEVEEDRDAQLNLKISYDLEKNRIFVSENKSINARLIPSL